MDVHMAYPTAAYGSLNLQVPNMSMCYGYNSTSTPPTPGMRPTGRYDSMVANTFGVLSNVSSRESAYKAFDGMPRSSSAYGSGFVTQGSWGYCSAITQNSNSLGQGMARYKEGKVRSCDHQVFDTMPRGATCASAAQGSWNYSPTSQGSYFSPGSTISYVQQHDRGCADIRDNAHKVFAEIPHLEGRVLTVTIQYMSFPITQEVLYPFFSSCGVVERIAPVPGMHGSQFLVQLRSCQSAVQACRALQGKCLYGSYCQIVIRQAWPGELQILYTSPCTKSSTVAMQTCKVSYTSAALSQGRQKSELVPTLQVTNRMQKSDSTKKITSEQQTHLRTKEANEIINRILAKWDQEEQRKREKIATNKELEHFFQQAFDLFDEIQEEDKEIDSAYYNLTPTKDQEVLVNDVDTGLDSFFCEAFNLFDEAPKGYMENPIERGHKEAKGRSLLNFDPCVVLALKEVVSESSTNSPALPLDQFFDGGAFDFLDEMLIDNTNMLMKCTKLSQQALTGSKENANVINALVLTNELEDKELTYAAVVSLHQEVTCIRGFPLRHLDAGRLIKTSRNGHEEMLAKGAYDPFCPNASNLLVDVTLKYRNERSKGLPHKFTETLLPSHDFCGESMKLAQQLKGKQSEVNESPQDCYQPLYMNLPSCVFVNCVLLNWPWDPGGQVTRFMMLQVLKIIQHKNYWHNAIIGSSVLYLHHSRELPTQVGTELTLKDVQYLFGEAVKLWMLREYHWYKLKWTIDLGGVIIAIHITHLRSRGVANFYIGSTTNGLWSSRVKIELVLEVLNNIFDSDSGKYIPENCSCKVISLNILKYAGSSTFVFIVVARVHGNLRSTNIESLKFSSSAFEYPVHHVQSAGSPQVALMFEFPILLMVKLFGWEEKLENLQMEGKYFISSGAHVLYKKGEDPSLHRDHISCHIANFCEEPYQQIWWCIEEYGMLSMKLGFQVLLLQFFSAVDLQKFVLENRSCKQGYPRDSSVSNWVLFLSKLLKSFFNMEHEEASKIPKGPLPITFPYEVADYSNLDACLRYSISVTRRKNVAAEVTLKTVKVELWLISYLPP